jgi:hypothetical protein
MSVVAGLITLQIHYINEVHIYVFEFLFCQMLTEVYV